jgi:GNAT superfamily N-acetyltransferase
MIPTLAIRPPRAEDAAVLAALSGQLGYPVDPDELAERLDAVAAVDDAAVLVAAEDGDLPVGWIHVELKRTLVAPLSAQVMGLVVDDDRRSVGIGRELLRAGEAWALARGCQLMLVGTRITRQRAHRFYEREGYAVAKTSYFFEKALP